MPDRGHGLYRDQGIVLRGIKLGESDRILSVLTQSHGRIRVVAKGARKSKSRFGGRIDAFTHVDLQLYTGRELDILTQAEILGRFPRLRSDYASFTAAAAMADAVERTTPDRERNVRLFVLLRTGLHALEQGADDPGVLAYAFLVKAASLAGLHPVLQACVGCGGPAGSAFSMSAGGVVCPACTSRSDPRVSDGVLEAWTGLLAGTWEELRRLRLAPDVQRELPGLLLGFVQWQLDNRFRAFGLLASQ
ncbi:MAG TPA: DNA repair protein RecO [Actinomycetota bacterium]|nr:DNA repair protein RecO [Actinomycetota bacterium]